MQFKEYYNIFVHLQIDSLCRHFIRSNHKVLLDVGQFKSDCNFQFLWVEGLVEAICVLGQVDWTLAKFFTCVFLDKDKSRSLTTPKNNNLQPS